MDLESLSSDIHLLREMLSQVVRRIEGEEAYRLEEEIRGLAKRLRAAPSEEEARRLRDRLGGLELASLRTLIRAFSVYFDLINLAEQQARVRALRELRGRSRGRGQGRAPGGDGRGRAAADPRAGDRRRGGRRAPGACPGLPGLHRAPERGPTPDHPREAQRDRPSAQPDRVPRPAAGRARRGRRRDRRGGRDHLALGDHPGLSPDRGGRGPAVAGAGRGPAARRRPEDLPQAGGRAGEGLSRARVARPLVPPVRVVDRRRPGRPPERHAPGHGRGGPAPAGDDPRPLPGAGRRPLAEAQPLRPLRDARPGFPRVARARRRAVPRGGPGGRERALSGQVPDDLGQAPQDPRVRPVARARLGRRVPPAPGGHLRGGPGPARRPHADRRRALGQRRAGLGGRRPPRHDPPGRGLRRPHAEARPPAAQRPARPGARGDLPLGGRLPGVPRALARGAAGAAGARAPVEPAADPDPPGLLARDRRGGPDVPDRRGDPPAAVPRGLGHVHHQLDDRAGPPAGGPAAGARGTAVPARRRDQPDRHRPAVRGPAAAAQRAGPHGAALRAARLPAAPGAPRQDPGGDDRLLR